jgi:ParB family chromosome partitioning protein
VNQASSGQNNLGQGLTYIENIDIQSISLNPYQPRVEFDEQEIFNLAQSIKDKGLLQPLTVSRIDQNRYELIAGERRLRAIKSLGITTVPVIIRENVSDKDKAELALIENIQRQNLNPIEKAKGFADLHQKFEMTQENIATHLGISRSVVANTLRYLQLPKTVQNALREGHITEGHAKIIAGLPTQALQEKVLQNIISNALNVRQTEQVVKKDPNQQLNQVSPEVKQWIQGLSEKIHNKVEVRKKGKRYIVTMNFFSEEEIKSIYQKLL